LRKTGFEAVLGNLGTSEVFYSLLRGRSTLTDISEDLEITRPSVIEQLRRLQKAGLVKLGAKNGKYQHYGVSLEGLSTLFLNESTRLLHLALTRKTLYPSDEALKAKLRKEAYSKILTGGKKLDREQMFSQIKAKLGADSSWRDYLIDYLETYATTVSLEVTPILQAARDFENGLRLEVPRILDEFDSRTWTRVDESKRELLELLHIWAMLIREVKTLQEAAHESSLKETLGWQVFEELGKRKHTA
jgi:DNA-binding transcriptional regulator GbsR (MarR family)